MKSTKTFVFGAILLGALASCKIQEKNPQEYSNQLLDSAEAVQNFEIPEGWGTPDSLREEIAYDWFTALQTSELQQYIENAYKYNTDLISARTRIEQAHLAERMAYSKMLPTVGLGVSETQYLAMGKGDFGSVGENLDMFMFSASYEIDFWGKNRYGRLGAEQVYFSTQYQYKKAQQKIASTLTQLWYTSIGISQKINAYNEILETNTEMATIIQSKADLGFANDADVAMIEGQMTTLQSAIEELKLAQHDIARSIQVLTGVYPEGGVLTRNIEMVETLPAIPTEFPAYILEGRPDVIAIQYLVTKTFADIEIAEAQRLPSVKIGGGLGTNNNYGDGAFFGIKNPLLSLGTQISVPVYTGGALKTNIEIKNQSQQMAVNDYSKTIFNAFKEYEDAMDASYTVNKQIGLNTYAVDKFQKVYDIAAIQYEIGSGELYQVLQKQTTLLQQKVNRIDLLLKDVTIRTNLYETVGGEF